MPILITTPDMSAETWLGATGCAIGSQTCSGTMPALEPKPKSASKKIASRTSGVEAGRASTRMAANEAVKSLPASRRNIATSAAKPTWVMAMYQLAGAHRARLIALGQHQPVGRERHELPHQQKGEGVVGHHLQAEREQQHVEHDAQAAAANSARRRPRSS